jgi:putative mRNA 3-end processing factor
MINLKILGAGHEVGRSGILANYKESNVLFDYGIKLSPEASEYPAKPDVKVQSVVLSHAHLDHSGMIPALYYDSNPWLYLTAPTLDLSNILWEDTLKIATNEGNELPYSKEEIRTANKRSQILSYKQEAKVAPNVKINMYDAGHILGSALTKVTFDNSKSLLYTGDYMVEETRLHKGADLEIDEVDYMLVESTYGDRDHEPRDKVEKDFVETVKKTLDEGGNVVIPTFAIGRAQEIIDILVEHKVTDFPIYLDGMSQKAASVYMKYPGYYKNPYELKESLSKTIWIKSQKMRKDAVKKQSIIITTAGMLEGGPVLYYLRKLANDSKTNILMTGYQVKGTKGQILLETGKIEIEGEVYKPKGIVRKFDFSAHIGKSYLMKSISAWNPKKVVCVHGDNKVIDNFTKDIKEQLGIEAVGPRNGDVVKL